MHWDRHTYAMGQIHIWDRHTYGTDTHMGQTYRQTHIWDRHTCGTDTYMGEKHIWDRHTYAWDRHTWPMKNSLHGKKIFVCGQICAQIVLKPPPWPGDSKSVLRFRIGQWEVSYFCAQTYRQTNICLYNIDISVNLKCGVRDRVCSFPELLEASKHEWYHVCTNCLGHDFLYYCFFKHKNLFICIPSEYFGYHVDCINSI